MALAPAAILTDEPMSALRDGEWSALLDGGRQLDRCLVAALRSRGCFTITVSIDGPDAGTSDGRGGVRGAFAAAMRALESAAHLDLGAYVISRGDGLTPGQLERLAAIPRWLGARAWLVGLDAASVTYRDSATVLSDIASVRRQPIGLRCGWCGLVRQLPMTETDRDGGCGRCATGTRASRHEDHEIDHPILAHA